MHSGDLRPFTHPHAFDAGNAAGERGTRAVAWITAATMLVEIGAGWWYNSMALMADGFHMSSHAVAIGLSAFAYAAARRHAADPRFAFGTWKIEVLAAFASAIFLIMVAALMVFGSVERLLAPQPIHYREAMVVAVFGLLVNTVCALILGAAHGHGGPGGHAHGSAADSAARGRAYRAASDHGHIHAGHGHRHAGHDHHHDHRHDGGHAHGGDLNLHSAYVHVIADAATSVLAIVALAGGWLYGWAWLDPAMGLLGAVLVGRWARSLIGQTSRVLLDREMDDPVVEGIRRAVESGEDGDLRVADLHVWRVGRSSYACALAVVTHDPTLTPDAVRERLSGLPSVAHSTIEIHRCSEPGEPAAAV